MNDIKDVNLFLFCIDSVSKRNFVATRRAMDEVFLFFVRESV